MNLSIPVVEVVAGSGTIVICYDVYRFIVVGEFMSVSLTSEATIYNQMALTLYPQSQCCTD